MPSGAVHARISAAITLGAATLGGVGVVAGYVSLADYGGILAGCMAGLCITPDLDQQGITREERRLLRIPVIGWLVGGLWVALWWPYGVCVPHRSWLSHWPIIGTAFRVVYLATMLGAVLSLGGDKPFVWVTDRLWLLWPVAPWLLAAWAAQDTAHWMADYVETKRKRRKGGKGA